MWLVTTHIGCKHGFSTRHGGVSPAPFESMNLGGSQDLISNIERNRSLALGELNLRSDDICYLKQVHGVSVCHARPGTQEGDALVTNNKDHVLVIGVADCYPILFHDAVNRVIGAAHAGWRGTVGGIATNTVRAMVSIGAKAEHIRVLIGQGISKDKFVVGPEVTEKFREKGFPENCIEGNRIDLLECNLHLLIQNNILVENIFAINRCTFEKDFFSYRRDKGVTGRMWGLITMQ